MLYRFHTKAGFVDYVVLITAITLLAAGDSIWESQVAVGRKCHVAARDFTDVFWTGSRPKRGDRELEDVAELGERGAVRDRRVFEDGKSGCD